MMTSDDRDDLPDDLRELDARLRGIQFHPREALGPEIVGRVRRGERAKGGVSSRWRRSGWLAVGSVLAASLVAVALLRGPVGGSRSITVDRCCFDLDGGGDVDDGVLVLAGPDERVDSLAIYEDRDRSGAFTPGDIVRFGRGREVSAVDRLRPGLVTFQHCCRDYDGGGPEDDGVLVVGSPPDRILMAAIYDTRPGLRRADALLLR